MRKVLAIGGVPGTGKTSMVRKFMQGHKWEIAKPVKLLDSHYSKESNIMLFGKYSDDSEVFAGTDKLGMNVQPLAVEYIQNTDYNVLFEGDRLFNASFLNFISELEGVELKIIILMANPKNIQKRFKDRNSNQSESFLKSRKTKVNNIINSFNLSEYTTIFNNNNIEEQEIILTEINHFFINPKK